MFRLAFFCITLLASAPLAAQEGDDTAGIRSSISDQMQAFRDGDLATAFGFAAPGIQSMFATPERFGLMVENGYPMVLQPGEVTFGELREEGGRLWQKVIVRGPKGALHALDYEMIDMGGLWRIGGVRLLEAPEMAV